MNEEHLSLLSAKSVRKQVDLHKDRVRVAKFRPAAGLANTRSERTRKDRTWRIGVSLLELGILSPEIHSVDSLA